MPLAGGLLGVQLTLFLPRGADYARRITDCPPGFENQTDIISSIKRLIVIGFIYALEINKQ